MNRHKKTPANTLQLGTEVLAEVSETESLGDRIARYSGGRSRAVEMLDYLDTLKADHGVKRARAGLRTCANYLHFREYYTVDKVRLHNAQFCKQHLICPLCAMRRGSKALSAYLEKFNVIKSEHKDLKPYLLTLTVLNGDDLEERQKHLEKSLRTLTKRRTRFNSGSRGAPYTELCKAEAGVYTLELTNKGKGWHPHVHMIVLSASRIDSKALSAEWLAITKDSFVVDCRPITGDPAEGFMEVFKYAVKFSDLTLEDNWHAAQTLKGKRLLNSFGLFRGVVVPEDLLDEPLEDLPYWDRFYRYAFGHYQITGECPPQQPPANA